MPKKNWVNSKGSKMTKKPLIWKKINKRGRLSP